MVLPVLAGTAVLDGALVVAVVFGAVVVLLAVLVDDAALEALLLELEPLPSGIKTRRSLICANSEF